ncbi:MAG: hypothetical protein IPG53_17710 [Ignavibacteriales bacterium]|nr:hypothetical protein [Ignavibacteriales bacterium]
MIASINFENHHSANLSRNFSPNPQNKIYPGAVNHNIHNKPLIPNFLAAFRREAVEDAPLKDL